MADEVPWYSPNRHKSRLPVRQPVPGELLYEFWRESDHTHVRVELRDHSSWGIEAQVFTKGDFFMCQRFETRALAVARAGA